MRLVLNSGYTEDFYLERSDIQELYGLNVPSLYLLRAGEEAVG